MTVKGDTETPPQDASTGKDRQRIQIKPMRGADWTVVGGAVLGHPADDRRSCPKAWDRAGSVGVMWAHGLGYQPEQAPAEADSARHDPQPVPGSNLGSIVCGWFFHERGATIRYLSVPDCS
jgi:hypothetical protein